MSDPIINITDLAFRYLSRTDWALNQITMKVKEGEFVGVTGPSGAGKSTFCLCLNGLIPHVLEGSMKGFVIVDDVDTRRVHVAQMSNLVGLVFQDPRSQLTGSAMTVEEEIAFGLQNLGIPRDIMKQRIAEALMTVGLSGLEKRSPFELSGGEQQRLSLATVVAMRPKIMVLDEPTEMLDPEGAFSVMQAIHLIHEKYSITTVLVTNQPEVLVRHSERIFIFSEGRIISEDTPSNFSSKVRFLKKIGVRPTQIAQVVASLGEKGLWDGNYPLDEAQAATIIESRLGRSK